MHLTILIASMSILHTFKKSHWCRIKLTSVTSKDSKCMTLEKTLLCFASIKQAWVLFISVPFHKRLTVVQSACVSCVYISGWPPPCHFSLISLCNISLDQSTHHVLQEKSPKIGSASWQLLSWTYISFFGFFTVSIVLQRCKYEHWIAVCMSAMWVHEHHLEAT